MIDFDKELKNYAKREPMLVPTGFEERMDHLINQISKKGEKRGFRYKMLKPSFVAATIGACIVLASGIAYASGIISGFDVDWYGNKIRAYNDEERPSAPYAMAEGYVPESADEYAFRHIQNEGELRRIGRIEKNGFFSERSATGLNGNVETLDELQKLLSEADVSLLKVPSYIPEGYGLEAIQVSYYLSPKLIDPYMAPSAVSISKNGNQMQVFTMPDGYKKYIDSYQITLKNSSGSYLDMIGNFDTNLDMTFNVRPDTVVRNPTINGFPKAIYYTNAIKEGETTILSTILTVEQKMEAVEAYAEDNLDYSNSGKCDKPSVNRYTHIQYQVIATNNPKIDEVEMTRIIDSLHATQAVS